MFYKTVNEKPDPTESSPQYRFLRRKGYGEMYMIQELVNITYPGYSGVESYYRYQDLNQDLHYTLENARLALKEIKRARKAKTQSI
jgi:hypothetical protein